MPRHQLKIQGLEEPYVSPAQGIARKKNATQGDAYARLCAKAVKEMLARGEEVADAICLVTELSEILHNDGLKQLHHRSDAYVIRLPIPNNQKDHVRDEAKRVTSWHQHLREAGDEGRVLTFEQARTHYGNSWPSDRAPAPAIVANENHVIHEACDEEQRWAMLSQAFADATHMDNELQLRKHAAIGFFWWLEHDVMMLSGTETLSLIALEYLAHRAGFEVPAVRERKSLARFAQLRTLADFIRGWESGEYFDFDARNSQVMKWQRERMSTTGTSR